jgi:hypothetical protein
VPRWLKTAWQWVAGTDAALSWTDRVLRVMGVSASFGAVSALITWFAENFQAALAIGLVVWLAVLMGLLYRTAKQADSVVSLGARQAVPLRPGSSPDSAPASSPYPPIQEYELPLLLATRWVQGRSFQIEQFVRQNAFKLRNDISLTLNHMTFVDCQIYGPALIAPTTGVVGGKTFVDCSWDEDPWHWWKGFSEGRYYVGVIRLEDCVFRNCHFRGVGVVMNPDEYDQKMEEYGNP